MKKNTSNPLITLLERKFNTLRRLNFVLIFFGLYLCYIYSMNLEMPFQKTEYNQANLQITCSIPQRTLIFVYKTSNPPTLNRSYVWARVCLLWLPAWKQTKKNRGGKKIQTSKVILVSLKKNKHHVYKSDANSIGGISWVSFSTLWNTAWWKICRSVWGGVGSPNYVNREGTSTPYVISPYDWMTTEKQIAVK